MGLLQVKMTSNISDILVVFQKNLNNNSIKMCPVFMLEQHIKPCKRCLLHLLFGHHIQEPVFVQPCRIVPSETVFGWN